MVRIYVILLSAMFVGCHNSGDINKENLQKVSIGMRYNEVYDIMGHPKEVIKYSGDQGFYRLLYDAPFLSSDYIYIFIDEKDSLVKGINDGS